MGTIIKSLPETLQKYKDNVDKEGGNAVNLDNLDDIANHLESYQKSRINGGPGQDGIYEEKTINTFRKLMFLMANDEITNNQFDQ